METENGLPMPKLCRVIKPTGTNYGFKCKLHRDISMEVVTQMSLGSPAQLAGLENGDRVFSVNGVSIIGLPHSETVALMRKYENHFVCMVMPKRCSKNWNGSRKT